MSNLPADSAVGASGAPENPTSVTVPDVSGKPAGQPNSPVVRDEPNLGEILKEIKAVNKRIEKLERGEQSAKDRGVRKLESELADLRRMAGILEVPEEKVNKVVRDVALDRVVERELSREDVSPQVSQGRNPQAEYEDRVKKRLMKLGIPEAEFELATNSVKGKTFDSWDDAVDEAIESAKIYQVNKRKQESPASLAGAIVPTGGGVVSKDLTEQYIKEFSAAYGNPTLAKSIRDKYRKQGVNVGSIGWGAKGVRNP